jgi:predicted MPP superfamily phosphohydrolase
MKARMTVPFVLASMGGAALSVAFAALLRGGIFVRFVGVLLAIQTFAVVSLAPAFQGPLLWIMAWAQAASFVHIVSLLRPQLRDWKWRALISWPGQWFVAGSFAAFPWAVAAWIPGQPFTVAGAAVVGWWIPYVLALVGLFQSGHAKKETLRIDVQGEASGEQRRAPELVTTRRRGLHGDFEGLRIVQITDPHLGPFMSVDRLREICERAVAAKPDLILLTGDFYTMESQHTDGALRTALAPLREHPAVFACRGNHDLECPELVASELTAVGVRLLIDEAVTVETRVGPVEIVGLDFRWRNRAQFIARFFDGRPRPARRIVLQHDPGAFHHLPPGVADLVLSGHTHGGQVGLVSFGLPHTFVSMVSNIPDHGPWVANGNRLYVHRANGHYGFPIRFGVPAEESVLELQGWAA